MERDKACRQRRDEVDDRGYGKLVSIDFTHFRKSIRNDVADCV